MGEGTRRISKGTNFTTVGKKERHKKKKSHLQFSGGSVARTAGKKGSQGWKNYLGSPPEKESSMGKGRALIERFSNGGSSPKNAPLSREVGNNGGSDSPPNKRKFEVRRSRPDKLLNVFGGIQPRKYFHNNQEDPPPMVHVWGGRKEIQES